MVDDNLFPDYRMADTACPRCGNRLEACTNAEAAGGGPGPGDLTLCAYCSAALVFTEDLDVRPATAADLAKLDEEGRATLAKAAAAAADFRRRREGGA